MLYQCKRGMIDGGCEKCPHLEHNSTCDHKHLHEYNGHFCENLPKCIPINPDFLKESEMIL